MRSKMKMGIASLALLVLALTGCSGINAVGTFNADDVACTAITTDLEAAQASLADATSAYDDAKGRPSEKAAAETKDVAQQKLDALNARQAECNNSGSSSNAVPAGNSTTELSPELKALLDAANAPLEQFSCSAIVESTGGTLVEGTYTLFLNTLLGVKEGDLTLRQWGDALSTVLKGSTPDEMKSWLQRAICEEPLIGASLAHLFAHLEIEGVRVLDLQSTDWLKVGDIDTSEINDLAASFMPVTVWKLQNIDKSDVPDSVYVQALEANRKYQELASRLIFLLSRYELSTQVTSINSTHHYHLVAGGTTADNVPEVEIKTDVDARPALVFYLTEKTACKPISVLGFNVGDKRPMLGEIPETCESFVPPQPPPSTPPGNGGCESGCGTPPMWKDSPTQDPYVQGNAPVGGGRNADSGPGTYVPPAQMTQPPSAPYVPPAAPAPVVPSQPGTPAPTPDPAPAPAPQPSAPSPSNPETGCDASIPGVTC